MSPGVKQYLKDAGIILLFFVSLGLANGLINMVR